MKKRNKTLLTLASLGLVLLPSHTLALQKSETIYTNLNYDGSVAKSSVSNHLSFIDPGEIQDETELKNILNIKGDESFTQSNKELKWTSLGNDIFYTGITEKNMPIKTNVTYYLDGEETDPEDMIGESGHIKIEYHFTNDNKNYVSINGHMETIYTPFMTTVATVLNDHAKNIHITNGKLVNTGTRTVALGIASPGLCASTKINELSNMDSVIISFDTDKFTLGTTYIVSTPKILKNSNIDLFQKTKSLSKNISDLETNMTKLTEGAKALETGTNNLATGSNTLTASIEKAANSMKELKNGSIALDSGIDKMISELNTVKSSLENPALNPELAKINALKEQNKNAIETYKTALTSTGLDLNTILAACEGTAHTDLLLDNNVKMFCLINANNTALDTLTSTTSKYVDAILEGLKEIKNGTNTLSNGMTLMDSGIGQIYEGSKSLTDGSTQLKNGALTLSTGTKDFKEQGIDKLATTASSLITYSNRVEALVNLSKNYNGFASSNSDETIFVYMIKPCK